MTAVLVSVPSEDAMFELLSGLNVSGIHPELACSANGHAYLSTLTDPDAAHVHIVVTNETGLAHCCICEHDGLVPDKFAPCTWAPDYPVDAIVTEWPDEARCRDDEYDVWWTTARDAAASVAKHEHEVEVRALRWAADEAEAIIASGDVAEVAAPVEGEVGRGAAVDRRDALYEEPHTWLRDLADRSPEVPS